MSRVIGIDLGTTNCCVAVIEGNKPNVLANRAGYKTTPSVVAITEDGRRLVGQLAVRQAVTNAEHTVYATKRLIGRTWDSKEVQHAVQHCTYKIVQGPNNDARIELRSKMLAIPEISAILLSEMRLIAEDHLGEPVERAVVTVPAYFNDNQRQAVRDAGRIAGLDVLRILNEPTAAAIAYGFRTTERRTIVVYDMGGGTFDVSIVTIDPDRGFDVVATTGDSYLGGEDFDDRLVDWMTKRFEGEHGLSIAGNALALSRMRQAAQKAKAELSDLTTTEIQLPFLATGSAGPVHFEAQLSRADLEQMTAHLVTRSLAICEKALSLAGLKIAHIDEVVLVGGMTRMPAIQRAVAGFFERDPCKGVHPDEVVAIGAAIHGEAIANEGEGKASMPPLHDVTAHSLGIMTAGGRFDPVIPGNTTVPTRIANVFSTSRDGQDTVKIVVLQGESDIAKENEFLGQFALTGLRSAPAGEVEIEVVFEIDADGIFRVAAIDRETGEAKQIEVLAQGGLREDEVAAMMEDASAYVAERRLAEQTEKARQGVEVLLADLERMLPEAERKVAGTPVAVAALTKARKAVEHVRASVRDADGEKLGTDMAALQKLSGMIKQVLAR
ncbi:MAG: molecular chaperone DnaK [Sandaracinus sp.]